jgi:hypothetical protein
MRPTDDNELMLKWFSGALALSLIAALAWEHRDFRSIECSQWLEDRFHETDLMIHLSFVIPGCAFGRR